ncbi:uncharacterized protein [Haliotis cracherodii]|uniref:uncharacterized protein n=1 Tax=Haliotis cracherodii TaxID=6455 RepID=UPI0039E92763
MKFKRGTEPLCYSWAQKQQRLLCGQQRRPRPVMTQIPAIPTLPQIPNLGEVGTVGEGGPQEGLVMPLSVTDRVTQVQNNMYENYLQKSTQKLQDEIHHTMKMYSVEKQQLLKQLASLRHNMSELKISDTGVSPRFSDNGKSPRYSVNSAIPKHIGREQHRLPPIIKTGLISAVHPNCVKSISEEARDRDEIVNQRLQRSDTDLTFLSDEFCGESKHNDNGDVEGEFKLFPERKVPKITKTSKDIPVFKLPQIKEEAPRPLWYSGNNSQTVKQRAHSPLTALPQIHEMRQISENNFDIPAVKDPLRCEISIPTKSVTKKVHFAGSNSVRNSDSLDQTNSHLPQLSKKKFQMHKPSRKTKKHFQQLPNVQESSSSQSDSTEAPQCQAPQGTEEWKSLYANIHDPEERTKTLGDILYAVRVKMRENEQNLMFGHKPVEDKTDNTLCDYLLVHKDDQDGIRKTRKILHHHKRGHIPSHTAERLHRRSNAVQLQNYLKKLSRQRRMIEHMEGEEYRLTHIVGHRQLQEAAHKSVQ